MLKTLFKGVGNYSKTETSEAVYYFYFGNKIGTINKKEKTFSLNSCGFVGYSSTTRALNDLERYYKAQGYKLTERK